MIRLRVIAMLAAVMLPIQTISGQVLAQELNNENRRVFQWQAVTGADRYFFKLLVEENGSFTTNESLSASVSPSQVACGGGQRTCYLSFAANDFSNGNYRWAVRARHDHARGDYTSWRSFTVSGSSAASQPPASPTPSQGNSHEFVWSADPNADRYFLRVDERGSSGSWPDSSYWYSRTVWPHEAGCSGGQGNCLITIHNMVSGEYRWRVRSENNGYQSAYTDPILFAVGGSSGGSSSSGGSDVASAPPPAAPPAQQPDYNAGTFVSPTGNRYRLAWSDEFSSLSLGTGSSSHKWADHFVGWGIRHLRGNDDEGWKATDSTRLANGQTMGEWLRSQGRWGNQSHYLHEVSGGKLTMRTYPSRDRNLTANYRYIGSMISGEMSHSQRYGYWEVRIRARNVATGHHLTLWLLPKNGSWPPEIDMLEMVGQKPWMYTNNLHRRDRSTAFHYYDAPGGGREWVTLGVEWTPSGFTYTVNGNVQRHVDYRLNDTELYFVASWEIGSEWPGDPDGSTQWPAEVDFDYVRIYEPL